MGLKKYGILQIIRKLLKKDFKMKIITLYSTSKGIFHSKKEAFLKKNRYKDTNPHSHSFGEYEDVEEMQAVFDKIRGKYFQINEIEPK